MNRNEYIAKLELLYVGDRNCLEELITTYDELENENKQLKEELYEAQRQNNELEQDGQDMAKELSIRIDKAIEYIENHLYMESDYGIQHPTLEGKMNYDTNGFELLEILKGES